MHGEHPELHGTKHSFPTRRSSDLPSLAHCKPNGPVPWAEVLKSTVSPGDRKSTRLNSSHFVPYRMPSSALKKKIRDDLVVREIALGQLGRCRGLRAAI